jgi:hypothetical protein
MAIKANIIIDQGTSYSTNITLTDDNDTAVDLTGYTVSAQFRKTYTSANSIAFATATVPASGIVALSLSSNASANVTAGRYVYDVVLTSNTNVVSRVVEGIVTITPRVTK